ncbi:M16 family metallopeptidase [Limosilactobacillus sp.]|uniref:EF-P 5-aminopentanol modification-associated protein YfmF n=1 Tax=Limosilactobacillus sp. TaxID=2773925 RepID=UPI00345E23C8
MDYQIRQGVNLHIVPTDRFRLTTVVVNFSTPQSTTNPTARHLLANVLESSCQKYPTQTLLARRLDDLYGTFLSANVARVGQIHNFRLRAQMINDHQAGEDLFEQVMALMAELLFSPLKDQNGFDPATVKVQRDNLAGILKSAADDKQFYAYQQVEKQYYDADSVMWHPSYGELDQLAKVSAADLVKTYEEMLATNQVDIFVLGDVDSDLVKQCLAKWPLKERPALTTIADYHQPFHHRLRVLEEHQSLSQAKLDAAFALPIYYRDQGYYAALVMNGLLGGSPYSKLFLNVREKAGLAYYADSQVRAFGGHLVVETGILTENYQRVRELIAQQVADLQSGDFTDDQLSEVKAGLINGYLTGLDSPLNIIEHRLVNEMSRHRELIDVPAAVQAVSRQEVIDVANLLRLQAVYFLGGDQNE